MKKFLPLVYGLFVFFAMISTISFANSLELAMENDVFIHDDSDYSHGTQVKYTQNSSLWKFDDWGIDILQNMYTPGDISSTEIQYGDRPYCGLLLGSFYGDNSFELWKGKLNWRNELGFGFTGRNSFAKESQKIVHAFISSKDPKGWDHQIKQEVIIQYQGYLDYNVPIVDFEYLKFYNIARASIFAGTFKDQIAFGYDLKAGINPKENMGGNIAFSASNKERKKCRVDLLFGVEGKYVLWDTSLDGGLFRDSEYTIDSKDFVGEIHYGFEVQLYGFGAEFLIVNRTKEYEGQDEAPDYCRLGFVFNF